MANVKNEVEYKLPKKMKKRRQLDALVDTMKLPRGRKNGSSTQDLLDYNSDSSEVDEFSLPQMTAKRKNRCCVCQSMIARISLFIISMACLTTCFGLIWVQWHIRHELDALRSQVHAVQTNDKVQEPLLKQQNQIDQVNKTFMELKRGVDELNKTLSTLASKIVAIEVKNADLEKSVSAAKEFVNTPVELHTLAETVAKLGSDQSQNSMALEAKLKQLEDSMQKYAELSNGGVSSQEIKGQVDELQKTITSQIGNVSNVLNLQGSKLSSLETLIQSLPAQSAPLNNTSDSVSKLNEQVSATLEDLKKTYLSGNITERGEFLAFKQETFSNTEKINETLYILSNEFDALAGRLDTIDSAVINITSAMNLFRNDINLNGRNVNESTAEPSL